MRSLLPRFLALALLALPASLRAQDDTPIFIERLDVNVINVEVFVTDQDGKPVVGLTADDFELYEDGKPVEISNFFAVARPERVAQDVDLTFEELDRSPPPAPPKPEDQQLSLVVFVDHFNLHPEERNRVLDDLGAFLEDRINQGDRVMFVSHRPKIEVALPFTRDREEVFAALERLKKVAASRSMDDMDRRQTLRLMNAAAEEGDLVLAHEHVRSYVQRLRRDLRITARGLDQVVRSLSGLPGRRAILYVSSGLPQRPGEDLYQHLNDSFGFRAFVAENEVGEIIDPTRDALREDESELWNEVTREANAQQVTIYTLDARGSAAESSLSAEYSNLGASPGGRLVIDQIRSDNYQEPLIDIAATTGGRAVLNTVNFDDVLTADLGGDFDNFYSLGYRPRQGYDGEYHKIEVRVKRPGVKVRHRTGYENKPEAERVADRTLSSLLLEVESNPMGIAVDFGAPEDAGIGKLELPLLVRIPIDNVTLLPKGDVHEGRLRIYVVAQDEDGISAVHQEDYPVQVPTDQLEAARGREIGWAQRLRVRSGTPKVAVAVWDELAGSESLVQQRVLVEKPGKAKKRKNRRDRGR